MKQFFGRFISPFTRDDLFMRVACALAGLFLGGIGVLVLWAMVPGPMPAAPLYKQILVFILSIASLAIGAALILRSVLSIHSRVGKFFDRHIQPAGLCGLGSADASLLIIFLPAILLTLLLRGLGVRGQNWSAAAEQEV